MKAFQDARKLNALQQAAVEIEQQGFNRGVSELAAALKKAIDDAVGQMLSATAPTPAAVKKPAATPAKPPARRKSKHYFRAGSDQGRVFEMIRDFPGYKGFQVLAMLKANGTAVNERTFRTALNRLKKKEFIEQRDTKWYPKKEHENKAGQLPLG